MQRIEKNEERLDTLNTIVKNLNKELENFKKNISEYYKLNEYYGSKEWLKDKEDYEKGKYKNTKAGVLSEDSVWNLDEEVNELITDMNEIINIYKMSKEECESIQYQTIDEQTKQTIKILEKNTELMDILNYIHKLKLPNFYIAAGSIFQTIWNYYDKKPLNYKIKDIDIIYYNKNDLSVEKDIEYYNLIKEYCIQQGYNYEIDVSNEARMHLWKKEKFNIDVKQYINSEDAIDKWIATVHAIGITKEKDNIKIYAPYGLNDIYTRTIRPIKHKYNTKEIYEKKVQSWSKRFDNLNIIEW